MVNMCIKMKLMASMTKYVMSIYINVIQ